MRLILTLVCAAATLAAQSRLLLGVGSDGVPNSITFSHGWTANCADATTCAVTATQGVVAGDLLVIEAQTQSGVFISSISGGGTCQDSYFRDGQAFRTFVTGCYVLSASAVSPGGTITLTFSATSGGAIVKVEDDTVVGIGLGLDATADTGANSGVSSPVTGPAITLTGTADVVSQFATAEASGSPVNVTAVNGSWTNTSFVSNVGFANQVKVASVTAPAWTAASPDLFYAGGMAFGFNPTSCVNYGLVDFSGGSDTQAPTVAKMKASSFGFTGNSNPSIVSGEPWYWTQSAGVAALTFSTAAHHALQGAAPRFCNGGTTYTDSGTVGLRWNSTSGGSVQFVKLFFPYGDFPGAGVNTTAVATCFFRTTFTGSDTVNQDIFTIHGNGGSFSNVILHSNGNLTLQLEGSGDPTTTISANTWYQLAILFAKNTTGKLMVFSEDGSTQIGSTQTVTNGNFFPNDIDVGDTAGVAQTGGRTVDWDKIKVCYLGTAGCTFPIKE